MASKSLVKWLKILGRIGEQVRDVSCIAVVALPCSLCPVPYGGGVRLPFIGQGESELHVCRTI
jgi:hypothetical protein